MTWHLRGVTHGHEGQWSAEGSRVEVDDAGQSGTVEKTIVDLDINWTDDRDNQDNRVVFNAQRAHDYALRFPPRETE